MLLRKLLKKRQSGDVKMLSLLCLALCSQFGYTASSDHWRVKYRSMRYYHNTNIIGGTSQERVTNHGMVLDRMNHNFLLLGMVARNVGCIVRLPLNDLASRATTVAGDCVKTRVPACKFDCMHDDGPTHSDDSAVITASLTKPEHLHSLTNGDVLFIDSATCVRRIRDRHVLTLFGNCGHLAPLNMHYSDKSMLISSFLYIEEKKLMVFAIDKKGIYVSGPQMEYWQVLPYSRMYVTVKEPPPQYTGSLVRGEGLIVYHKIQFGINKYNFTDIMDKMALTYKDNYEPLVSYPENGKYMETAAKFHGVSEFGIQGRSYGMSMNPFYPEVAVIAEYARSYAHVYTVDLKSGLRESACSHEEDMAGFEMETDWCVLENISSPIWIDDNTVLAWRHDHKKLVEFKFDLSPNCALWPKCPNGGTCVGERCICLPGFTGVKCETDIEHCTDTTCSGHGECFNEVGIGAACQCEPGYAGHDCSRDIDDCARQPCGHGGTCHDGVNTFTCECTDPWTGRFCEDDVEECRRTSCTNEGTCMEKIGGGVKCFCKEGFTGKECEINIYDCWPNQPCINEGKCVDGINSFKCECPLNSPWTGLLCQRDVTECSKSTCGEHGECKEIIGGGTHCLCEEGWTGSDCRDAVDLCDPNPCANGATCVSSTGACKCTSAWEGKYCTEDVPECNAKICTEEDLCRERVGGGTICLCPPGLTGERCQTNIDDCNPNHCADGSTCVDGIDGYTCTCPAYRTGVTCEDDIPDCKPDSCAHGWCGEKHAGGLKCFCDAGYTGDDCATDIDDCANNRPCINGATCTDLLNDYVCTCPPNFTGKHCGEDVVDCTCNTCNGNGRCIERFEGGFFCSCTSGWTGETCNINMNDCNPNPCANGGVCEDGVDDYECNCQPGWTGKRCTDDIPECTDDICGSNGKCHEKRLGGFICECDQGYTGSSCTTEIENDVNQ